MIARDHGPGASAEPLHRAVLAGMAAALLLAALARLTHVVGDGAMVLPVPFALAAVVLLAAAPVQAAWRGEGRRWWCRLAVGVAALVAVGGLAFFLVVAVDVARHGLQRGENALGAALIGLLAAVVAPPFVVLGASWLWFRRREAAPLRAALAFSLEAVAWLLAAFAAWSRVFGAQP